MKNLKFFVKTKSRHHLRMSITIEIFNAHLKNHEFQRRLHRSALFCLFLHHSHAHL